MMAHQIHGVTRREGGSVVTDDWHAVAQLIVAPGVSANLLPASAFVDVAVRADHKAEGANVECV